MLALFLVVILTVLGLGLMLRSKTTMAVAGAERPITKNFYGADGGIQAAYARLQVANPCAFQYTIEDVRGGGGHVKYEIDVNVAESVRVGDPQLMYGSQVGGAVSGGGNRLVFERWRVAAGTEETASETRRAVEAEVMVGPTTLAIPAPCGP